MKVRKSDGSYQKFVVEIKFKKQTRKFKKLYVKFVLIKMR